MNAMEDPDPMRSHIRSMNASMRNMTITGNQMRNETTCRGPHIDHPLSKMNSIFSC
jgi:alkyl hydroperoxide reductase subunit AhpF